MIVKYKVRLAGKYVPFARNFVLSGFIPKVLRLGLVCGCSQSRAGRQTGLRPSAQWSLPPAGFAGFLFRFAPWGLLSARAVLSACFGQNIQIVQVPTGHLFEFDPLTVCPVVAPTTVNSWQHLKDAIFEMLFLRDITTRLRGVSPPNRMH